MHCRDLLHCIVFLTKLFKYKKQTLSELQRVSAAFIDKIPKNAKNTTREKIGSGFIMKIIKGCSVMNKLVNVCF